jgi:hypothetical protein
MNTVTSTSSIFEEVDFSSVPENDFTENKNDQISSMNLKSQKNEEVDKLLEDINTKVVKKEIIKKDYKGRVFLKAEWDGRGPDMPPTKIEDRIVLHNKQKEFKNQISIKNRYDYPYDVNDPRNLIFFDEIKKAKTELLLKYLYKEYMLPFHDAESLRHFLLVKRFEKFSLRKFKVPILEWEIERSDEIKQILKDLQMDNKTETQEEIDKKIKDQLAKLNTMYSGRVLNDDEYIEMLNKKVKALKKDVINKLQFSYFQIINEFYYSPEFSKNIKETIINVFSRPRKLKPKRIRQSAIQIEKSQEIKINVHIVKGYNMPVRFEAVPHVIKEQIKSNAIGEVYKAGIAGGKPVINQLLKNSLNQGIIPGLNNSAAFNTPHVNSNNQSMVGGINIDMNTLNAMNAMNAINPNLNNIMYNPNINQSLPIPMYNQPNTMMNINATNNYDGDILHMVELLRNVEKNVETVIQVKQQYYDQEVIKRTDSVSGIHPDINCKMQFTIKPRNGKQHFDRDEILKCSDGFYFTLYDEVRTEQKIQAKDSNTYIYRYEKKYLGAFEIPFTTIFQNSNLLDAMCKVNVPMTVFGYYTDTSSTYDILQQKEEDLRKKERKSINNEDKQNKNLLLIDSILYLINHFRCS